MATHVYICARCDTVCVQEITRGSKALYCEDCRRVRDFERDDALNQGHGQLRLLPDYVEAGFVLAQKAAMDREREECQEAVAVALREGAAMAGRTPARRAFALEVDEMLAEADAAVAGMPEDRKARLVGNTELGRSRTVSPRAPGAVYRYVRTRGRPRAAVEDTARGAPSLTRGGRMFQIRERDWIVAEAESLAAARACVEALVKPGNLPDGGLYGKHSGLDIYSPKGEWVMNGKLNEHGEVVWRTTDLTRQHERTVIG